MIKNLEDISNYGDLLAYGLGGFLISYNEYGSYQGDYVAVIEKNNTIYIYKGSYGSCSGCDWLQDRMELTDKDVKEYLAEESPFIEFSRSQMPETAEDLKTLLPANTRMDLSYHYEDSDCPWYVDVFNQLIFDREKNLEYLEFKSREHES